MTAAFCPTELAELAPLNNNDMIYAYASQLNSLTHLRALLVLHDRGILAHGTSKTSVTPE
jgi:hypothetical protein